jgi:SagB-type dehydrogenase family enzyme
METSPIAFELTLIDGTRLVVDGEGVRIAGRGFDARITAPAPALVGALTRLANGGVNEDRVCQDVMAGGDAAALFSLFGLLQSLDAGGQLRRVLRVGGRPFATLVPRAGGHTFRGEPPDPAAPWRLSRYAYLHAVGGRFQVDSPLGRAAVELHEPAAAAVVAGLAAPGSAVELGARFPEVGDGPVLGLLTLLLNASALVPGDDPEQPGPRPNPASWWEFHDLLFHMRSRLGRQDAPYGGTYRLRHLAPPPLARPEGKGARIPLDRPNLDRLRHTDPPFTDVLERRRSLRRYGEEPLGVEQLGEFLYRSARYQAVIPGGEIEAALRPSPSGGALQELEVYPVVARCRGLAPGAYRYDPARHDLTRLDAPPELLSRLLEQAWVTANRESPVDIYLGITARCRRVFWKYESMGYALILKNLGALYATMYLVATAMGLAPCALGGGDSELFSQIAGLDPFEEPPVGEFILGSRGDSR